MVGYIIAAGIGVALGYLFGAGLFLLCFKIKEEREALTRERIRLRSDRETAGAFKIKREEVALERTNNLSEEKKEK